MRIADKRVSSKGKSLCKDPEVGAGQHSREERLGEGEAQDEGLIHWKDFGF